MKVGLYYYFFFGHGIKCPILSHQELSVITIWQTTLCLAISSVLWLHFY